jgi:hypothetical protein
MRQKSGPVKESAEKVVKDIRRATRRRQRKGDRSAAIIGQSMDFTRSSAARTANRFRELPLFEPAAERCALTWLLSMESSSGTGPAAAIFSKMRCQIRRWDQRL